MLVEAINILALAPHAEGNALTPHLVGGEAVLLGGVVPLPRKWDETQVENDVFNKGSLNLAPP